MTRTVAQSLAWAGDGAAHLRDLMSRMADDAYAAPSALPGWSRAHVLTHLARNADAMGNLLTWARTGVETPAYASDAAREADIEAGAARPPAEIRADVKASSDRLAAIARAMPEAAWSATVRTRQGVELPAAEIPWWRAREMWIHAVDLDVGAAISDMPPPMLQELVGDVVRGIGTREGCPPLRLRATDRDATWVLGDGSGDEVVGPVASLAAWVLGRSKGKDLRAPGGRRPVTLPAWL